MTFPFHAGVFSLSCQCKLASTLRGDRLRSNGFFSTTGLKQTTVRYVLNSCGRFRHRLVQGSAPLFQYEYDPVLVDLVRPSAPTVLLFPIAVVPCADPLETPRQVVGARQLIPLATARHSPISRQKRNPNLRTLPNIILRIEPAAASHTPVCVPRKQSAWIGSGGEVSKSATDCSLALPPAPDLVEPPAIF